MILLKRDSQVIPNDSGLFDPDDEFARNVGREDEIVPLIGVTLNESHLRNAGSFKGITELESNKKSVDNVSCKLSSSRWSCRWSYSLFERWVINSHVLT